VKFKISIHATKVRFNAKFSTKFTRKIIAYLHDPKSTVSREWLADAATQRVMWRLQSWSEIVGTRLYERHPLKAHGSDISTLQL
jgi:hypothetical protein